MRYRIHHTTRFRYSQPIRESVMELRMQPRTDGMQRCLEFELSLAPDARWERYSDFLGNAVHHFDIPSVHDELVVTADALVDVQPDKELPGSVSETSWARLDELKEEAEYWDWLHPSHFAHSSDRLEAFAKELSIRREADPLTVVHRLSSGITAALEYQPGATQVDSPIDDCLKARKGVCQDFAHVFIAVSRGLGIPTRYVSGYLFHRTKAATGLGDDASHAWAEAYIPEVGWLGFDPSNQMTAGSTHVRVAVGRDYQDVPPTRGVFRGSAETELNVHVDVTRT